MIQYITDPFIMIPIGFGITAINWWAGSYCLWKTDWPATSKLTTIIGGCFAGFGVAIAVIGRYFI